MTRSAAIAIGVALIVAGFVALRLRRHPEFQLSTSPRSEQAGFGAEERARAKRLSESAPNASRVQKTGSAGSRVLKARNEHLSEFKNDVRSRKRVWDPSF